MKIALLQYPIQWADPQTNLGLLDERLRAVAGQVELAVIPEMFSTGFCTDRPGLADEWLTGHTSQALQHMADEYNLAIVGSMMVMDHGKLYNRGFIFRPNDSPQYYDKHHLYASGGEAEFFTPGNERKLFEFRGVKIRLAVCYDLRFPVWLRQDKNNLYDILICVACWPTIRILDYNGHSAAYDTWLKDLAGFEDYESGTCIVDLSIEKLRHFREVLPQWKEADEYELIIDN